MFAVAVAVVLVAGLAASSVRADPNRVQLPNSLDGFVSYATVTRGEVTEHTMTTKEFVFRALLGETAVVASRPHVTPHELAGKPLMVPDRRSRPHSHDLGVKIMETTGREPVIAQVATEKQTIVHMVSARLGSAIVPRWTSRMTVEGVAYVPLEQSGRGGKARLPLPAAWIQNSRDPLRGTLADVLFVNLKRYSTGA